VKVTSEGLSCIDGYKKCSIIVKNAGWDFMVVGAQAQVKNCKK
jgi:hypothetical protein